MKATHPQPPDHKQIDLFLADAFARVEIARGALAIETGVANQALDSKAKVVCQIAYEAMLKGSIALMFSHGQRPREQSGGHHRQIIQFAASHLQTADKSTFDYFDRMRTRRNTSLYGIGSVFNNEAEEAIAIVRNYLELVSANIASRRANSER